MSPHKSKPRIQGGKTVALSANTSWNIVNFRASIMRELRARGFEVVALSPEDSYSERLGALGSRHVPLAMDNKGTSPLRDAALFLRYLRLLRQERPSIFLGWTIKPNVYGSFAAHLLGIPVINNVSGLGTAFMRDDWLTGVVKLLYRLAYKIDPCILSKSRRPRAICRLWHCHRPAGRTAAGLGCRP
jgi:hypothetical protein